MSHRSAGHFHFCDSIIGVWKDPILPATLIDERSEALAGWMSGGDAGEEGGCRGERMARKEDGGKEDGRLCG